MDKDCLQKITELVEEHYDIGEVKDVYEIFGGYINRSFGIVVQTDNASKRYFLRKYKQGIAADEVKFEHALINHCIARGLTVAARVIANRQNTTYVTPPHSSDIFAVYDYLPGHDKYTWDNPTLNDEEYRSAAKILAAFHDAASDFDPKGLQRKEAKILDLLPTFSVGLQRLARTAGSGKFHRFFLDHLDDILEVVAKIRIDAADTAKMLFIPIHCDYHPGNLKFENNRVVGIFDFDWSKIDLRLFDVSLAVVYFCSSWQGENDGELLLNKCPLFLTPYQEHIRRLGGPAPLNSVEIKYLPAMLAAANLYLINWIVVTYYADADLSDDEYLTYLRHTVRLMHWIKAHGAGIVQMASRLARS